MTFIANEVASAGIGVDIGINGLDQLLRANATLHQMHDIAEKLQNRNTTLKIDVAGMDKAREAYDQVNKLNHNFTSNIDVHTSGVQMINGLQDRLNQLKQNRIKLNLDTSALNKAQVDINDLKRSMNMNINTNGGSHINALDNEIRRTSNDMGALGNDSRESFDKVGNNANNAKNKITVLNNTGHTLRDTFAGSSLGSSLSNAFTSLRTGAENAVKSGMSLVSTGNQVRESWQHIGVGNSGADAMVEQMDHLRDAAGMDEQAIQQMQKSFYSLTGSAPQARSLTNEIVSFGKASGESNQQIARMGQTLPRMLSTGKVSGQMFNRTFRQSPALINALAKASGESTSQFRQMADSGKMTSQQLEQYMQKAAKGSSNAMDQFAKTFQGQMTQIRGIWTGAKEDFAKPFTNNLSNAINQTTKSAGGLGKVQQSVGKLSSALGKRVGNAMGTAIGWLVKNQKPLINIGSSLFRILKAVGSGVWKSLTGIFRNWWGNGNKSSSSLNNLSKSLSGLASHASALQRLGKILANIWIVSKIQRFNKSILTAFHSLTKFAIVRSLQTKMRGLNAEWQRGTKVSTMFKNGLNHIKSGLGTLKSSFNQVHDRIFAYRTSLHATTTGEHVASMASRTFSLSLRGIGMAFRSIPIVGWIQIAIDGITMLYTHSAKFRRLVNPLLKGIGKAIGWIGDKVADFIMDLGKGAKWVGHLASKVTGFFHLTKAHAASTSSSMNRYTRNSSAAFKRSQRSNTRAASSAHKSIDRDRSNSSKKFKAYISRNGKIYRTYHKGTTRISKTTYAQREALRRRYYRRYESSLKRYEANYRKYQSKRSSLSRKYGKLRAMYSQKSLRLIEKRFKGLKNTVVKYAKTMYKDTQRWFKRLGTGAGKQFRGIYRSVRKYLRMSNREATKDFRTLYRNSRRWLNGSVNKYVRELKYRYTKQRYYDRQLVKQAKATGQAMYKLPLGWISRETKDLIRNWKRQRASFITHNERMTHAEVTHTDTMQTHINQFSKNFEKTMDDLEDDVYSDWSSFWTKMHNRAGSGINSVQNPLNTGAEHINSFVRAFGETTSPLSTMPEVSYATGTGMRRPITRMVRATLNDGHDSPETNNQETVLHPNGQVEFPKGQNIQEMLEPGTEVLNATETKLMGQMAHFAPTVHLASGTGLFGNLFSSMSSWIKNALSGGGASDTYDSIAGSAKDTGDQHLLNILQGVLKQYENVLAGFMGSAPSGQTGVMSDITQGIYGQTSNQIDKWWQTLMSLTNQALNNGSSSDILNYAEKNWMGVPYVYGAASHSGADCGGAVQSILAHFNIPISHTDMEDSPAVQYIGKDASTARPGDLVMFGGSNHSGPNSHVGIYAGHGQMWNETPPRSTISPVSSGYQDGFNGYYRIKGHSDSDNPLDSIKTNTALGAFVKNQNASYLKFISDKLAPLLNPDPGAGPGVAKWRPIIQQAAEAMHVNLSDSGLDKVMSNIQHESNGNETVENDWDSNAAAGDPSVGLVQFIKPTFDHYAMPGHNNIRSGYDQLLALFNDSSWYSDIAPGGGWGPSGSRRYARGGRFHAGQLMTVGERGEELIKPDVSGEVIPHNESKRILNKNNNSRPVKVEQHNTFNVTGGDSRTVIKNIDSRLDKANDSLADKLARLSGFDEGGRVI